MLVLGLPIVDTALFTWQRLTPGRSPFQGGHDDFSHRLVWAGTPVPVAVCLLHAASVALEWLALIPAHVDTTSGLLPVVFVLTVGTLLLGLLAVPAYENSSQRRSMLQVVRQHEPEPVPHEAAARSAISAPASPH
jgi:hypothetical protein